MGTSDQKSSRVVVGIATGAAILIVAALLRMTSQSNVNAPPAISSTEVQSSAGIPPTTSAPPTASPSDTSKQAKTRLSAEETEKIKVLNQILSSKNDNDPRLDTDFKTLTPELKQALAETYTNLPNESRNQKGTLVFLLGRSISTAADIGFLASVLNEPPCLSLENCTRSPGGTVDEHASMANDITVVYPQLVAIKSIERFLNTSNGDEAGLVEARKAAIAALETAQKSDQQRISAAAAQALQSLNH